jgi:hypothetical protein
MDREEFFSAVAEVLGVSQGYVEPMPYRRRWKRSRAGNGLYEGIGIVRWYSESMVHVALEGHLSRTCASPEEALEHIRACRLLVKTDRS